MRKTLGRPQLKTVDDIFKGMGRELVVEDLELDSLTPFDGHLFRPYGGERLEDMAASIEANGVLNPILVRMKSGRYEILSGHNRVNGSRVAGKRTIPCIVLGEVSDEEAIAYVVETNLMQRSFADMSHSEKAAVISTHHGKMFSQGKRNDILERLKFLEKSHADEENETFSQSGLQ